jgi:hypothetical protein
VTHRVEAGLIPALMAKTFCCRELRG